MKRPLALIIMDGYGYSTDSYGNAIHAAQTPNLDRLMEEGSVTYLGASGMDVGLPDGQMGNSEVGHTNIGAGRVVYQELTRITKSIEDGDFFQKSSLVKAMDHCLSENKALHLMGLLSDGGVHSHNQHLYSLLEMAKRFDIKDVFVHCFMDGRDVPPSSGKRYIQQLVDKMQEIGIGKIATISGRYYAMDRDHRWDRVEQVYEVMVYGKGNQNTQPISVMDTSYANHITDEFVVPTVCHPDGLIKQGDSVIFFNFRPDRAREITRALVDDAFEGFARKAGSLELNFVCMTQYDATMPHVDVAFKPQTLLNTFGSYISQQGLTQLRIAETEKYAHVTFFFNGGVETTFEGEERVLISSPKVATYDLKPEMSVYEVCDEVIQRIESDQYDVIIQNFANCDMVGHTGIFDAAKTAVEAVDTCVGRTVNAILQQGGVAIITADHGNADQMYESDGSPFTAHTTNPVPFIVVGLDDCKLRKNGKLADIAPTMLDILGLQKPDEMDGVSLVAHS